MDVKDVDCLISFPQEVKCCVCGIEFTAVNGDYSELVLNEDDQSKLPVGETIFYCSSECMNVPDEEDFNYIVDNYNNIYQKYKCILFKKK